MDTGQKIKFRKRIARQIRMILCLAFLFVYKSVAAAIRERYKKVYTRKSPVSAMYEPRSYGESTP